ncbi:hypothetical protein [Acinetobacter guillouiae]|uniref:hypothetical protein n=1 Tax=Acinetobacter TaxID=469 RepID=UPI003AF6A2B1
MKIKNIIFIILVASTTSALANQSNQKIDFERITTKQLTDLNEKCLNNDYKGDDCKQLKQYQKEQREKGQKAAEQLIKHSH